MGRHVEKPWGSEEWIHVGTYAAKILRMSQGHQCSLQYHKVKHETVVVMTGQLRVFLGVNEESLDLIDLQSGESLVIEPGMVHQMQALSDCVYLEASSPEMDDVVRIRDSYGRETRS